MNADPETVFSYIDPTPDSPRSSWDRAIKELQVVANIAEVLLCSLYVHCTLAMTTIMVSVVKLFL